MEVDQKKTGGDMKVECKLRSGGDMPTPLLLSVRTYMELLFVQLSISNNTDV